MLISGHLNALAALTFIGLTGITGAAVAAGPSSQFDVNGDVGTPSVDTLSRSSLSRQARLCGTSKNPVISIRRPSAPKRPKLEPLKKTSPFPSYIVQWKRPWP